MLDIETTGADGVKLSGYNALMYRGYYYDADFELYYLETRFFDPVICRFINADDVSVLAINQGSTLQYNMFAYCLNNSVCGIDSDGTFFLSAFVGSMVGGAIGGAFISAISYAVGSMPSGNFNTTEMLLSMAAGAIGSAALNYCTTLMVGTPFELLSVGAQNITIYGTKNLQVGQKIIKQLESNLQSPLLRDKLHRDIYRQEV